MHPSLPITAPSHCQRERTPPKQMTTERKKEDEFGTNETRLKQTNQKTDLLMPAQIATNGVHFLCHGIDPQHTVCAQWNTADTHTHTHIHSRESDQIRSDQISSTELRG
jgi:hypothetical protein